MGTACSECDLEQIQQIDSDRWDEIVPVTPLRAGYEETRLNFQKVNCFAIKLLCNILICAISKSHTSLRYNTTT